MVLGVTDLILHHKGHFITRGYCNLGTSTGSGNQVNMKVFVDE